jgi:hypothetical protein
VQSLPGQWRCGADFQTTGAGLPTIACQIKPAARRGSYCVPVILTLGQRWRPKNWPLEGVWLSIETVRQLLIGEGLWKVKCVRRPVIHQLRERRARWGELVQIDGSPHDWFEGRAPKCTLLVFVDDATSRLMYLQFVDAETTFNYFAGVHSYLTKFGKPLAFYSDKFGVFRINIPNALSGTGLTQFGRALKELTSS